ncbi:MAG: CpaF family protein, partial [Planctomycetales bacterium]|nr:CpaF family protein [Planctomycetales bacterium]
MNRSSVFEASTRYFLAPIQSLLEDPSVTEVMINRFDQIYVERGGKLYPTECRFADEDSLLSAITNVAQWVGRDIGPEQPILDARLPDGSRVNVVLPPSSRGGVCVTIRRFTPGGLSMRDLINFGSLTEEAKEFLELCVHMRKNVVVSGGTGTGKTSLLGALSEAIPDSERIVVIEDTSELMFRQPHTVYLEVQRPDEYGRGGVTIRQLFTASLRMRPDRIVVGEVRGGEALDMVQSMLSGHSGSLTTVHASQPRDAMVRLETLSLMSDVEIPMTVARAQVA